MSAYNIKKKKIKLVKSRQSKTCVENLLDVKRLKLGQSLRFEFLSCLPLAKLEQELQLKILNQLNLKNYRKKFSGFNIFGWMKLSFRISFNFQLINKYWSNEWIKGCYEFQLLRCQRIIVYFKYFLLDMTLQENKKELIFYSL